MLQTRRSEAYFSPGTDIKVDFSQITSNQLDTTRDTKYNMNGGDNPMSKWEKLIQRILSLSKDLRFDELRKVLESCGY